MPQHRDAWRWRPTEPAQRPRASQPFCPARLTPACAWPVRPRRRPRPPRRGDARWADHPQGRQVARGHGAGVCGAHVVRARRGGESRVAETSGARLPAASLAGWRPAPATAGLCAAACAAGRSGRCARAASALTLSFLCSPPGSGSSTASTTTTSTLWWVLQLGAAAGGGGGGGGGGGAAAAKAAKQMGSTASAQAGLALLLLRCCSATRTCAASPMLPSPPSLHPQFGPAAHLEHELHEKEHGGHGEGEH